RGFCATSSSGDHSRVDSNSRSEVFNQVFSRLVPELRRIEADWCLHLVWFWSWLGTHYMQVFNSCRTSSLTKGFLSS
ncbi:hypothetical protein ILYODFUR_022686, partial [Ilyodon furcidens]